jgi:hypothetical protein
MSDVTTLRPTGEPRPAVVSPSLVIVPAEPGRLVPFDPTRSKPADELDLVIDEMFGPTTDERPGRFDFALLAIGASVLGWAFLTGASGFPLVIGIAALVLGLALPTRTIFRTERKRRAARSTAAVLRSGHLLLDVSHPSTARLTRAYAEIMETTDLPGWTLADQSRQAAHLAVVEVASLLRGKGPIATEEIAYVDRRTEAIQAVHRALVDRAGIHVETHVPELAGVTDQQRRSAAEVARARDELEAASGVGSLADLRQVTEQLRREADHDA